MRTRRELLQAGGAAAAAAGMGTLSGCASAFGATRSGTVRVSSARYPESILLSYMALESLRANTDLRVLDETALGGTPMNFRAVKDGEVTLYWMYTGGAWTTLPPVKDRVIANPEKLYRAVERKMKREHDLVYLNRAPYNNTYILITTPDWAEKTGVTTMTDFANHVNAGNTGFTTVMGPEFSSRPDGWPGLAAHYGFADSLDALNVRNVGPSLTYQIIATGGAEVGVGFSTNPNINRYGLTTIDDNERFFPPYNPAPLVNGEAIAANPAMRAPLNAIGPTLNDTETIMRLNGEVTLKDRNPQTVAREYLRAEGLL
jgi:osmoprotectant transport system substrate-binding protein